MGDNLGSHGKLRCLDLSFNAGGFVVNAGSSGSTGNSRESVEGEPPCPTIPIGEKLDGCAPSFNPLSLLIEGVSQSQSLTTLRFAQCQLNYDEDFMLEDACAEKVGAGIEELDLTGNPCQGPMGARCLLRMVVRNPALTQLAVKEFRESLPASASVPYEFPDPTASYSLDLVHPQHRALLRTLLRRCREANIKPEDAFKFAEPKFGMEVLRSYESGTAVRSGLLSFNFQLPELEMGNHDIRTIINMRGISRKLQVGLCAFVRVAELFRHLSDEASRCVLIEVMAMDMLLKICHVRYLSELDCRLREFAIDHLLPAVKNLDCMAGLDLLMNAAAFNKAPLSQSHPSTFGLLLFNPDCANARYNLNLAMSADRRTLEQILIVNEWEKVRFMKEPDRNDLSQNGGYENLRNVNLNGNYIRFSSAEFAIPPRGQIIFDYTTPFHAQPGAVTASPEVLKGLCHAVRAAACDAIAKVAVARTVLHRLSLTPQQCSRFVQALPERQSKNHDESIRHSPRVDAFCAVYPRCVDIEKLLSGESYSLYGSLGWMLSVQFIRVVLTLKSFSLGSPTACTEASKKGPS
eukprot:gnl/TRDRNA2_/TRDRNA2_136974_c2_seq1.p1 gnl/TRDRNA2_/TRDRNA2_136974_c2~~gnl/TRDRNA2_/TRDRNA2_136974_c2_seq1.p1  ORF type:complete len:641 (-),score=99.67 gnl/TRDRNA2_/TRDRNA2_136974_c2_seq1:610-2337(-)